MSTVVLEHVDHVVEGNKWVVDCDNLLQVMLKGSAEGNPPNPSESVNTNVANVPADYKDNETKR